MKVLLKSLKELEEEYGIEKFEDAYIVFNGIVYPDMVSSLGKIVEAEYDEKSDSYIINAWYFHPNFVKGEVIDEETTYIIKRLSDGKEYTLSL